MRRAVHTQNHIDGIFSSHWMYSSATTRSEGELQAHFGAASDDEMASDRRVDIFVNRLSNRPPLRLPMQHIAGRLPPELDIREVVQGSGPTNWTLATRTSDPPTSTQPGQTPGHPVAIISRGLRLANQAAIEERVVSGINDVRPIVAWQMIDHGRGGSLIVAAIDVREHAGQTAGRVMYVRDHPNVFAKPQDAIGNWRSLPRLESPTARAPYGRIEYRFFWATRR